MWVPDVDRSQGGEPRTFPCRSRGFITAVYHWLAPKVFICLIHLLQATEKGQDSILGRRAPEPTILSHDVILSPQKELSPSLIRLLVPELGQSKYEVCYLNFTGSWETIGMKHKTTDSELT